MGGEVRSPDGEVGRTDVRLYAVMKRRLRLATDLPRLTLGPRPGCARRLNPAAARSLIWPHARPLVLDAPLNLPTSWRKTAPQPGLVLFVGDSLGLRKYIEAHLTHPAPRSPQAAQPGKLAVGAITYSRRQQPLRSAVRRAGQKDQPTTSARPTIVTHGTRWTRFRLIGRSG